MKTSKILSKDWVNRSYVLDEYPIGDSSYDNYIHLKTLKKGVINSLSCDRDRIRTCDRLLRRQMLYPAELLDQ